MFKKIVYLLIFLSLQLGVFVQPVFALDSCKNNGITWKPDLFNENAADYTLTFTINDDNVFQNLKNHPVALLLDPWDPSTVTSWMPAGHYFGGTPVTGPTITDKTFTIPLTGNLTKNGIHNGYLRWIPTGQKDYQDFCSNVSYQVGAVNTCNIASDTKAEIPPNTPFDIRFAGIANTQYRIQVDGVPGDLASTTTDGSGQGGFKNLSLPGGNGTKLNLRIFKLGPLSQCFWPITITATASPVQSSSPGVSTAPVPIQPGGNLPPIPPAAPCTGSNCTSGGVGQGCGSSKEHPAIATAIGCIHTNPNEFAFDLLTFVVAIGGGLAFLMMLLGAFQMLTSAGNPETLNAGRERITSAVIGLLFVIFAILLLQIIGFDILKLPGFGR